MTKTKTKTKTKKLVAKNPGIAPTLSGTPEIVNIAIGDARECRSCHSMHVFFINRDGTTRCLDCDTKYGVAKALDVKSGYTQ
jgi:hypothetical protein